MSMTGITPIVSGKWLRIASVKDELEMDVFDPLPFLAMIRKRPGRTIDIFTFAQRIPETTPKYDFPMEWDSLAVLDYGDHKHWFEGVLDDKTRNMIRKAGKKGVEVRIVDFDDELIRGIVAIYNETPVRQGRPFKHFGKNYDEAKEANATHLDRSEFIGAFYGPELIGFVKLVYGVRTARAEQIISKIAHRDKAPTNALLNEAVKMCQARGLPYLIYGTWPSKESFAQFKKNNGFKEYRLPRYFVPLTIKGRIGIRLGLHRGFKEHVPGKVRDMLIALRERWYGRKPQGKRRNGSL